MHATSVDRSQSIAGGHPSSYLQVHGTKPSKFSGRLRVFLSVTASVTFGSRDRDLHQQYCELYYCRPIICIAFLQLLALLAYVSIAYTTVLI